MQGRKFYCHNFVCLYLLKYLKVRKAEWQNYVHIFGDTKQRMEHIHKQIHYMFLAHTHPNAQNSYGYLCKRYLEIANDHFSL